MLLTIAAALASCALDGALYVEARPSAVVVDGVSWTRDQLVVEARVCGYARTEAALAAWEQDRRRAWLCAGVGLCFGPAFFVAPVYAVRAYEDRNEVEQALLREAAE